MARLDLHGIKHEDVHREVIRFVEDSWDCGDGATIITGHSGVMKDIVIEVLEEYKLEYEAGFYPASIKVYM